MNPIPTYNSSSRGQLLAVGGAIILIVVVLIVTIRFNSQSSDGSKQIAKLPILAVNPNNIPSSYQNELGQEEEEVEKLPGYLSKKTLADGLVQYNFKSDFNMRANMLIFKNNKLVFKNAILMKNKSRLSEYLTKYGQAEKNLLGSAIYGENITNHVFPSKGIAIIGNDNTNEVYEIQNFTPLGISEYLNKYGTDFNNYQKPEDESSQILSR